MELRIKAYIDPINTETGKGIFKFWIFDLNSSLDRDLISIYYKTCCECIYIYSDSYESAQKKLESEPQFSPENVYLIDYHEGIGDSTTSSNEELFDQRTKSELSAFENYFSKIEENKEMKEHDLH